MKKLRALLVGLIVISICGLNLSGVNAQTYTTNDTYSENTLIMPGDTFNLINQKKEYVLTGHGETKLDWHEQYDKIQEPVELTNCESIPSDCEVLIIMDQLLIYL